MEHVMPDKGCASENLPGVWTLLHDTVGTRARVRQLSSEKAVYRYGIAGTRSFLTWYR
jgi:hypothetical protein